jgi:hypothetical protein
VSKKEAKRKKQKGSILVQKVEKSHINIEDLQITKILDTEEYVNAKMYETYETAAGPLAKRLRELRFAQLRKE